MLKKLVKKAVLESVVQVPKNAGTVMARAAAWAYNGFMMRIMNAMNFSGKAVHGVKGLHLLKTGQI